jgi:hypothetical protein
MMMVIKEKSWIWWLTIFASPKVHTTIYPNIYVAKRFNSWPKKLRERIIRHEKVHLRQQQEIGLLKYLFLYIFVLPVLWNPWRYQWEMEAYMNGSGYSIEKAKEYCKGWNYGFLINSSGKFNK